MSIRYKVLLSLLIVACLTLPVNFYLFTQYSQVKKDFLNIVDSTVPRLQALLTMKNLATRINLFINNFNYELQQVEANSNTPSKIGATKDQLLAYLEELGEQQKIYQKHSTSRSLKNAQVLDKLRDEVVLTALALFAAKEHGLSTVSFAEKAQKLENAEGKLNEFIKVSLNQESSMLEEQKRHSIQVATQLVNQIFVMNAAIVFCTLALSILLTRFISKPIIQLSNFASNIDYDNLNPLLPILTKDEIGELQKHLNTMLIKLSKTKSTLIETSRSAGIAEITTSILHNVGNVLNSINISIALLTEHIKQPYIDQLPKILTLLEENQDDLTNYLKNDEKGKLFFPYFRKLTEHLEQQREGLQSELERLNSNLEHVNQVIAIQQSSGNLGANLLEKIRLEELLEDVIILFSNRMRRLNINLERQYGEVPLFLSAKTKIQQVVINCLKNAIEALSSSDVVEKRLIIKMGFINQNSICVEITDNGVGIKKEHLKKLFSFGFTTKTEGHGYGLHNSVLIAKELGGDLRAVSGGVNQGATFIFEIPYKAIV